MSCHLRHLAHTTLLALLAGAGICSCGGASTTIEGDIVDVQKSPDGQVIATLSKAQYGATVADVYRVYMSEITSDEVSEVLRASDVRGMQIAWSEKRTLAVRMQCGKIFRFLNFFYIGAERDNPEQVSITLGTAGPCPSGV
jgi:hypothetical protein